MDARRMAICVSQQVWFYYWTPLEWRTLNTLQAQVDYHNNLPMAETITVPELDRFEVQYWRSAHSEHDTAQEGDIARLDRFSR